MCKNKTSSLQNNYEKGSDYLDFGESCLVVADPKYRKMIPGFDENLSPLKKMRMPVFNVKMTDAIWRGHGIEQDSDHQNIFLSFLAKYIPFSAGRDSKNPDDF